MIRNKLETFKLGSILRFLDSLQPNANPDFDEYQEQFPPKSFRTPEQTWHTGDFNLRGTNVNFGQMAFAQAKAIDLAWNALVGRGVQAVLIYLSCRVFYAVLMYISERHSITYELFAAVSLTSTGTNGCRSLFKAVLYNSDLKSRLMLLWLLGTTIYIALTPILIDALSGYRAIQATVLQIADGSKLDVSSGFTSHVYQDLRRNQPPDYIYFDDFAGKWYEHTANFKLTSNATMIYFSGQYRLDNQGQNISDTFSSSCINATTSVLFLSADHYTYFRGASPLRCTMIRAVKSGFL
ncbi:hypothetical protein IFR04_013129 [Cadophora malorum]|uniref:Uncharacterized protein n=1 Tax=Cadophora malorum TaxID=108018 RepID=A0A8H7T209_9HELO|nr:hypothetical protein IFR04_013129 [Cadophora malorum]